MVYPQSYINLHTYDIVFALIGFMILLKPFKGGGGISLKTSNTYTTMNCTIKVGYVRLGLGVSLKETGWDSTPMLGRSPEKRLMRS